MASIREKILSFIVSQKDIPLLAGFSIGLYLVVFIYARNFGMYNSLPQFLAFLGYYMLLPMAVLYCGYKILPLVKLGSFTRHFLFVGITAFLAYYLLEFNYILFSKKIAFTAIVLAACMLSFFLRNYYKLLVLLLFLMCAFNIWPLATNIMQALNVSCEWAKQPDGIENIALKHKPNIYYIQPDGYTSFDNLRDSIHNFDNSSYEAFLNDNGFTLYRDYRSNYASTLLSNSAMFAMKHHYDGKGIEQFLARDIIMGDNPVLRILKNNGYQTFFITESPYLTINRPELGYDETNIPYGEIPYIGDSSGLVKDAFADLKLHMKQEVKGSKFYFIEKFTPSHIYNNKPHSRGVEQEKKEYLKRIAEANTWLKNVVSHIVKNDPDAMIIIGADHGGFAGYAYMSEAFEKRTANPLLARSIFGAQLAIKWNKRPDGYNAALDSSVNLFRVVFASLAEDKKYLDNIQDNSSYITLESPKGLYRYIDSNGKTVFEKYYDR